ncbi:MAG: hypothetical protein E5W81_01970 [Mesorhizobium sp.]|nr:MAG: hypothetical protein E5W81_01970 [Mesorhizobium sp.]
MPRPPRKDLVDVRWLGPGHTTPIYCGLAADRHEHRSDIATFRLREPERAISRAGQRDNGPAIDLDTSADLGASLTLSITDTTINNSENTVSGIDADVAGADATVTFSDDVTYALSIG